MRILINDRVIGKEEASELIKGKAVEEIDFEIIDLYYYPEVEDGCYTGLFIDMDSSDADIYEIVENYFVRRKKT